MVLPVVIELPRLLQPVERDDFADEPARAAGDGCSNPWRRKPGAGSGSSGEAASPARGQSA